MNASQNTFAAPISSALPQMQPTRPNHRTFIEFFAGIGLTHLGLAAHHWRCIYANDIEPKKKKMYENCFGPADYYHVEDVWETDSVLRRIQGRADLATASFPCVDLSLAGNLKGFSGVESGAFFGFVKVLKELKRNGMMPHSLLIENVIGFLSADNGKHFSAALDELCALGYSFDAFILDAKYFTPQSRPRLFLIAFTDKFVDGSRAQWFREFSGPKSVRPTRLLAALKNHGNHWVPLELPVLPPENRNLRSVIDTDEGQEWWESHRVKKHLAEMHASHRASIEKLRVQEVISIGTIYRRVRQGRSTSEIRTDGLAGCLRTPRGGSSKQIVFTAGQGNIKMRWMSPREYARLQGCPDFPIEVPRNEALFGFGDAVCVPVISWIAENLLSQLFPSDALCETAQAMCD